MPNVLQLIADDHRKVEDLFDQFESTGDEAVAAEICDELTIHTTAEETQVYPDLRKLDADLENEAEHEHDEAKELIEQIRGETGDALVDLVQQLREAIEHHVSEEESDAFAKLQQLGDERLDGMGDDFQRAKQQALAG